MSKVTKYGIATYAKLSDMTVAGERVVEFKCENDASAYEELLALLDAADTHNNPQLYLLGVRLTANL